MLLKSGVNINEVDNFEETPLLSALYREEVNFELIQEFVYQGADVNAKDCWGVTPLYRAVVRHGKDLDLIRFLLENGADIQSGKNLNDRFLDHTVTRNNECAKLLVKYKFLKNYRLVLNMTDDDNDSRRDHLNYSKYKYIVDLDLKPSCYNYLANYLNDCTSEILQMNSVLLNNSFTLLDLVVEKNALKRFENTETEEQVINNIFNECYIYNYNIYKDVIATRIGKRRLLKKLDNKLVYSKTWMPNNNRKKVILDLDLIYHISDYLNDIDLFNIVVAFSE
ncbi:ANK_REP_REGION domain-containing protein [Caerostris extrusa]|uniref:ANK_REP_REGION domain-containing protein n=1 Tax=Caerostris extrusa TaxID=172846 RepID=A0AAV4W6L1_CAEEX|nr:ANK_REP_REGION domain-containing protein [Caerostris extrusa]